jgi:hypothetical protein
VEASLRLGWHWWLAWRGTSVRNGSESMAAIAWTEWMRSSGFGGLIQRNTQYY